MIEQGLIDQLLEMMVFRTFSEAVRSKLVSHRDGNRRHDYHERAEAKSRSSHGRNLGKPAVASRSVVRPTLPVSTGLSRG